MATIEDFEVHEDEALEELRPGLWIIQKQKGFRFGTDSVLLADFVPASNRRLRIGDFGTGSAVLPLLIYDKTPNARFTAWEIQPDIADMAWRSVCGDGLDGIINVICADARLAHTVCGSGGLDALVCNPPYYRADAGGSSPDDSRRTARQCEPELLTQLIESASKAVRWGGRLYIVYPAAGAAELLTALRQGGFEPKRLRCVHARIDRPARLVLIDAVRGGGTGLEIMPPAVMDRRD